MVVSLDPRGINIQPTELNEALIHKLHERSIKF